MDHYPLTEPTMTTQIEESITKYKKGFRDKIHNTLKEAWISNRMPKKWALTVQIPLAKI